MRTERMWFQFSVPVSQLALSGISTEDWKKLLLGYLSLISCHLFWQVASGAPQSRLCSYSKFKGRRFKMELHYALQQNFWFKRHRMHFPLLSQLRFSGILVKWQRFFAFLAAQQGKDGKVSEQRLELKQMQVEDFIFTLISAVLSVL